MIEIDELVPFYICNKARTCNMSSGCGDGPDMCHHTTCSLFAKNKDAVELFEAFAKRFYLVVDDNGRLSCTEKLTEDEKGWFNS